MCDAIREEEEKKVKTLKKWQSSTKQKISKIHPSLLYCNRRYQKLQNKNKTVALLKKKPLRGSIALRKERTKDQTRICAFVVQTERTKSSSERRGKVFRVREKRFQCKISLLTKKKSEIERYVRVVA